MSLSTNHKPRNLLPLPLCAKAMGSVRHLGHLSSWQNLFRDSNIDRVYYCSWHSDFVLNGTEVLRQTEPTARAVWKLTLSASCIGLVG